MSARVTDVTVLQRVGVLGGTFDPIHLGHLAAASEVAEVLSLDIVLLVPTAAHSLKGAPLASAEHRLAMCHLAADDDPRLGVSDVDIVRGGVTYTVDTLTDLAQTYPGVELTFITGADSLATLPQWKSPERLVQLARFVGVTRPGHALPSMPDGTLVVEVPSVAVSSTEVRRRVKAGAPIRYLVPDSVVAYIDRFSLYLGGMNE